MLRGAVRGQGRPKHRQRCVVVRHHLPVCFRPVGIPVAVPRELCFEISVVRAVVVAALHENYRENGADEKHYTEDAYENKEPGLVDAQVGVAWQFDVFNMVGVESRETGFAHCRRVAGLRVVVAGQYRVCTLGQQEGGKRWRRNGQYLVRWLHVNTVETTGKVLKNCGIYFDAR